MSTRAVPPVDISPAEFFERWVPAAVQGDADRRRRIEDVQARIQFELVGDGGGDYYLALDRGDVRGYPGRVPEPDLVLELTVETWRSLNSGELSTAHAAAKRALRFRGSMFLALKIHFLLR